ncbi:MAG: hypothetical protein L0Z53_12270 [Acidobacteriales bacterium]|nr:hypothetical protein [Terriglobales bacterium]
MTLRLVTLIFLLFGCLEAFPCTCGGPFEAKTMRDAAEWYASQPDVTLIFEGKVAKQELRSGSVGAPQTAMSMTPAGQFRHVDFDVVRMFRGQRTDHVKVITGLGGGDCGYDFQTGQSYLVFASAEPKGLWFTSICNGTKKVEDAGAELRFLAGEKAAPEDLWSPREYWKHYSEHVLPKQMGSICGKVLKPDGTPLKGARVTLWEARNDGFPSRRASDPNTSTDAGRFCIERAQPTNYLLTAVREDYDNDARFMVFYPGVFSREEAIPLQIQPGVQLPDVITTFREQLYTIRIRVSAADRTPLSYKNGCGVAVDSIHRDPLSYHISHLLHPDGTYTFGYIPAGKYVVSTYFQPDFSAGELKPFPEASMWNPARKEVIVSGDTTVQIVMERTKPN